MEQAAFEALVHEAYQALPPWVHEAMDNVQIVVADAADEDLDPHGDELLGLYDGAPLTERSANHVGELPDVIYVFRHAHLALGLPNDALKDEIRKTLMHEIAHLFGFDDDELEAKGWD